MRSMFNDIGLVTAGLRSHLTRLASIEKDPEGSTSTIEDEDLTEEERAERDRHEAEDLGDEDEGRRRGRDTAAYRELQGDRDRLKADLEKQQRETQALTERLNKIDTEKTERQKTNETTNAHLDLAKRRSREIVSEIGKIDANDPERAAKVYDTILTRVYEDLPKVAEEISERKARETYQRERHLDKTQHDAKQETIEALEEAGLGEEWYEEVEDLAVRMQRKDPGWYERVPVEKQIDTLVQMVKDKFNPKPKRDSQEFQDEQREHRKPMRGVIERGSQTRRSATDRDDDRDSQAGPGSILADMARAAQARRQSTKVMLRQSDAGR